MLLSVKNITKKQNEQTLLAYIIIVLSKHDLIKHDFSSKKEPGMLLSKPSSLIS